MTETRPNPSRRTVLRVLGAAGALSTVGSATANESDDSYAAVQDGRCILLVPLSGDQPVEELYDLRIPDSFEGDNGASDPGEGPYYSSVGTRDFQRPNTTVRFLYDGPEGLSLVVVHGALNDEDDDGGRGVSWTLEGEVLSDGEWVVRDDYYFDPDTGEFRNFDRWDVSGTTHTIDWTFDAERTDGAAFRSLGDEFTLRIDPRYNEEAALWSENYYDGEVTDWELLSFPDGDDDPERVSVDIDERLRIRSEPCDTWDDKDDDEGEQEGIEIILQVPGTIDMESQGLVTAFLFSGNDLDTGDIDVDSLRFGPSDVVDDGGGAKPEHDGHGGGASFILHFRVQNTGFEDGDDVAKLRGETDDGTAFYGTQDVDVRYSDDDDDDDEDDEEDEEDDDGDENDGEDREERDESRSNTNDSRG